MANDHLSLVNIALIGGGLYCKEVLEMTTVNFLQDQVNSRIVAVADPDPKTPGIELALEMGLVNKVVPLDQLEDTTVEWCKKIMKHSPIALRMIKAVKANMGLRAQPSVSTTATKPK